MTDTAERTDVVAEVTAWLEENWDPELTVAEWWERLGTSGWAAPTWPVEWFGRGLPREARRLVNAEFSRVGAKHGNQDVKNLFANTILAHGTEEQKRRHLPGIRRGEVQWCQLFSEPGAGSDLASLATRAERQVDGTWRVNG